MPGETSVDNRRTSLATHQTQARLVEGRGLAAASSARQPISIQEFIDTLERMLERRFKTSDPAELARMDTDLDYIRRALDPIWDDANVYKLYGPLGGWAHGEAHRRVIGAREALKRLRSKAGPQTEGGWKHQIASFSAAKRYLQELADGRLKPGGPGQQLQKAMGLATTFWGTVAVAGITAPLAAISARVAISAGGRVWTLAMTNPAVAEQIGLRTGETIIEIAATGGIPLGPGAVFTLVMAAAGVKGSKGQLRKFSARWLGSKGDTVTLGLTPVESKRSGGPPGKRPKPTQPKGGPSSEAPEASGGSPSPRTKPTRPKAGSSRAPKGPAAKARIKRTPEPTLKNAHWDAPLPGDVTKGSSGDKGGLWEKVVQRKTMGKVRPDVLYVGLGRNEKGNDIEAQFDGYIARFKILIEAKFAGGKSWYNISRISNAFVWNLKRAGILRQAIREVAALVRSGASKIEWHLSDQKVADQVRMLFNTKLTREEIMEFQEKLPKVAQLRLETLLLSDYIQVFGPNDKYVPPSRR